MAKYWLSMPVPKLLEASFYDSKNLPLTSNHDWKPTWN